MSFFLKLQINGKKNHLSLKIRNAITGLRKSLNIQKAYCHCAFIFVSLTCEEYPHIILSYLLLTFLYLFFSQEEISWKLWLRRWRILLQSLCASPKSTKTVSTVKRVRLAVFKLFPQQLIWLRQWRILL